MFSINRDKFFTILNDINKTCIYREIKDKYLMEIPKFNNLMKYIDLYKFDVDYVQNRLIIVKPKDVDFRFIKNLIICPIDTTKPLIKEECQRISYTFPKKQRNSYLTKTDDDEINESYCIKGCMNPAILNTILLYMISTGLFENDTMIVFSLKANSSKFDYDDIIEYLQKFITMHCNSLTNIINLNYTSLERGYPKRNYCEKIIVESVYPTYSNEFIKRALEIERPDFKQNTNFDLEVRGIPTNKENYKKILTYFNAMNYIEYRMFVFSDKPIVTKFHNLLETEFLVEWNTIEKMINHLYDIIKRGEN